MTLNELAAFYINNETKFTKYYDEETTIPFLLPAQFKNVSIRNYFCDKFNAYCRADSAITFETEVENALNNSIDGRDVCIIEWDLRDELSGLVSSIGTCLHELFSCHLFESTPTSKGLL